MTTKGRCFCGAIQYEFDGDPTMVEYCHCESCRRQTSSPVAMFLMVPKTSLRFTKGQPKEYSSSPGVHRSFCGDCGSPLYYRTERRPTIIDLFHGTLIDPAALAPQFHVHSQEQLPWFEIVDELPRYAAGSSADGPMRHGSRRA
jgi:hypothetical protein